MGWLGDRELDETKIRIQGKEITLRQIIDGTKNFSPQRKIGEGRFGEVYKSELKLEGQKIILAVKKVSSILEDEMKTELRREIFYSAAMEHDNVVRLFHCHSSEGRLLLIYEYMEMGSLHQVLFNDSSDSTTHLDWKKRFGICLAIAKGLKYIHEEFKIIHRKLMARYIMLDKNHKAKLTDFGLAMLYEDDPFLNMRKREESVHVAPELASGKEISDKSDVFSFGVVMIEIVCGRSASNVDLKEGEKSLLEKVTDYYGKNKVLELVVDMSKMSNKDMIIEARTIFELAMKCISYFPSDRPAMSYIVEKLIYTVNWKPPPANCMKVNVDCSVNQNELATAGGVIRDNTANWIAGFAHKLGGCSMLEAELWSLLDGLRFAWYLGNKKILVETDSEEAYNTFQGLTSFVGNDNAILHKIQDLKYRDWEVSCSLIYKEGNCVADWLSKFAYSMDFGFHVLRNPPSDSINLLERDAASINGQEKMSVQGSTSGGVN